MKKWILKAIVQKSISYLPNSHSINYWFQKNITKGVFLTDLYFFDRLGHAKSHLTAFSKFQHRIPEICLELGTGWYPVVPIAYFLSGADKIYSVDISFLTSKNRIKTTLEKFVGNKEISDFVNIIPERWEILQNIFQQIDKLSLEEILTELKIEYLIGDARKLDLADDSVDLLSSNNTFEHVYPEILEGLLLEFKRILKQKEGVMTHFIDMSDHFAHFDQSINIYNFLQFSEKQWKWIDNDIQPQNRWRIDDFKELYKQLNIPINEETIRKGDLTALASVALNEKFAHKKLEDVAVSHCLFVSVKL